MKKTNKILITLTVFMMILGLAACGSTPKESTNTSAAETQVTEAETAAETKATEAETAAETQAASAEAETAAETQAEPAETLSAAEAESVSGESKTAENPAESAVEETASEDTAAHSDVLVAYFSATGTTKGVAERIASVTGGDLYEILAAEPYTADDLNYNDRSSRSTAEQNDKNARPGIGSEDLSLDGYTTIYLGFPIWWGEEPRILDTFVEKYSFEGITVIPFCTSGGSGIGRSGPTWKPLPETVPGWRADASAVMYPKRILRPGSTV